MKYAPLFDPILVEANKIVVISNNRTRSSVFYDPVKIAKKHCAIRNNF